LEKLGRDLRKVVIIDNSPASYAFHPNNSVRKKKFFFEIFENFLKFF